MKTIQIAEYERDNVRVWGAKIIGLHKKYGLNREFSSYRIINDCSSKHVYYNYYILGIHFNPSEFVEKKKERDK